MESLKNADFEDQVAQVARTEGFHGDVTVKWEHAEDYLTSLEDGLRDQCEEAEEDFDEDEIGSEAYQTLCKESLQELYNHDCIHVTPDPDVWIEKFPWNPDDSADDVKNKLNDAVEDSELLDIKLADYLDYSKYIQSQPIPADLKKDVVFINKDNECVYKDGIKFYSCDVRDVLKEIKDAKVTASEKFASACSASQETTVKHNGRRL